MSFPGRERGQQLKAVERDRWARGLRRPLEGVRDVAPGERHDRAVLDRAQPRAAPVAIRAEAHAPLS